MLTIYAILGFATATDSVSVASHGPPLQPCATATNASSPWIDCQLDVANLYGPLPTTSVTFVSSDNETQSLFSHAEACEAKSILELGPGFNVVVEGGGYNDVWLETQPMGGAMYGVRNLRLAVNNQLIFMRTQRSDGRLPGMVSKVRNSTTPGAVHPTYSYPGNADQSMLQGFYMATPAVDVAWLMNQSESHTDRDGGLSNEGRGDSVKAYLAEVETALARFDGWLWSARNSSDGVLWLPGIADTGEDGSDKYRSIPGNTLNAPFESMDMMGYAHDAERALAKIASINGNVAAAARWEAKMEATAASLKKHLWSEEHGACFDRERDGNKTVVTTLVHNNIRAMWHGIFSQAMADAFIARHLMNTSEFWTPTPLPSIAASDARFQNLKGNNWSGPPEGLTFQRAIRALENYGHHAEVVMAGVKQKQALFRTMTFPQQIDPFTSMPDGGHDCYGPMLLSMLEFTALTTGIAVRPTTGTLMWSNIQVSTDMGRSRVSSRDHQHGEQPTFTFEQQLGKSAFKLKGAGDGSWVGSRNNVELFSCSGSTRVVTDGVTGNVISILGASSEKAVAVELKLPGVAKVIALTVAPNEEWAVDSSTGTATRVKSVAFTLPF